MTKIEGNTTSDASAIREIALTEMNGEPRARDLDIAERLGFDRPRNIRKLIERHIDELSAFGAPQRSAKEIRSGRGRVTIIDEYWLNEEQSLLVAVLSNAPKAAAVRAMLIRTFVAWRRGHLETVPAALDDAARRTIGGIVKGIIHKEVGEALHEVLPAMIREAIGSNQFGVVRGLTGGQVLDLAGIKDRKGLKGLDRFVSNRLKRYHGERHVAVPPASLGLRSAYVFQPELCREWLDNGGAVLIQKRIAEKRGQGVLKLVPKN